MMISPPRRRRPYWTLTSDDGAVVGTFHTYAAAMETASALMRPTYRTGEGLAAILAR